MKENIKVSILMPCLNEEANLANTILKAKTFLEVNRIKGEIIVADNGSLDSSIEIAKASGAIVVSVFKKGYGSALIEGSKIARGKYIIMGDSDDTYDFLNLKKFVDKIEEGYDLVVGNRFKGGIEKGSMPFINRYIGNPVLSFMARILFKSPIRDYHCGLRIYNKDKMKRLNLSCLGMEYASEMIVKATINNYQLAEIPTTLSRSSKKRKPHLRPIKDGFRHLIFLIKTYFSKDKYIVK